jgi:L-asparaginase
MTTVYVLTTGGKIEGLSAERPSVFEPKRNTIDCYLKLLRLPDCRVNVVPVMRRDGSEMTDQDRVLVAGMVRAILQERVPVVITHGTEAMVETGLYLKHSLADLNLPVVLTGAMTPPTAESSDGLQNLTESLFAAQTLGRGIYVVMHGTAFPAERVRLDKVLGRFVWSDDAARAF